jgi:hypothetical protein
MRNRSLTAFIVGAHGSVIGCGTMLQAGKACFLSPLRSLDSSIDLILRAAGWL